MSPLSWLRGRAIPIVVCLAGLVALYVMLRMVALSSELALLITLAVLLFFIAAAALDFAHDSAFWRSMQRVAQSEGPDALIEADNVEWPDSPHAQVAAGALDAVTRAANAEVARLRQLEIEHREFVEAWVHEVKTPLAAADLLVENARTAASGGQDVVELAHSLSRELARIDGYVEQALFFARATAVDRDYLVRSCELRRLVGDAVKSRAHALIGAGMAVEMEGLEREVFADPKWMGFVLGQLIDNAIKYRRTPTAVSSGFVETLAAVPSESVGASAFPSPESPVEGAAAAEAHGSANENLAATPPAPRAAETVTPPLSAAASPTPEPVLARERPRLLFKAVAYDEGRATEHVTLTVRDNGCGISVADIGRIFDKGFTGENGRTHAKSTGIGLYLVRQLCEKMGLAVQASSTPGSWTAIDIIFPTNRMHLFE